MILIGLLLPSLVGARDRARLSADLARYRQIASLMSLYAEDARGVYPVSGPIAFDASWRWGEAMMAAGLVTEPAHLDPRWTPGKVMNTVMTAAALADPSVFDRSSTVTSLLEVATRGVRAHEMLFPARKGFLFESQVFYGVAQGKWCCLSVRPIGPVGMVDGSARSGPYGEFLVTPTTEIRGDLGFPIWSTWDGARGIDVR